MAISNTERIFVRSDFMETLQRLNMFDWKDSGFKSFYRNRKRFEKTYIRSDLGYTLSKLYNVEQWPGW